MSHLQKLTAAARSRLDETKTKVPPAVLEQRLASVEPPRGFAAALRGPEVTIIAEIKRATPARGALDLALNAGRLATAFVEAGAAAISVLTEPDAFRGSLEDLEAARGAGLPVLRKDFIVDPYQVLESRAAGADGVLLIVRALEDPLLRDLMDASEAVGLDALVEVHDESELERAIVAGAGVIGVNHRNLDSFEVDPDRTAKLAPSVPDDVTLVALSGVTSREDVLYLAAAGAHSVLVGEALVVSPDPGATLRELLGRS